jgi:hypothetical protein
LLHCSRKVLRFVDNRQSVFGIYGAQVDDGLQCVCCNALCPCARESRTLPFFRGAQGLSSNHLTYISEYVKPIEHTGHVIDLGAFDSPTFCQGLRKVMPRDGCRECLYRRIRCDKTDPSCQKCLKKGLECSGVGKFCFVNGVTRHRRKTASPPSALKIRPSSLELSAQ